MSPNSISHFKHLLYGLLFILLIGCNTQKEPLVVHPLFKDHMVLQQQAKVTVWGTASPNKTVEIAADWLGQQKTEADALGNWSLSIETPKAGGPFTLSISSENEVIKIRDVLIGEVWLASGQSNMEMPLTGWPPNDTILNSTNEIKSATNPNIRMFTVQRNLSLKELNNVKGEWLVSSAETAGNFSATAYYFAKRLENKLNIPIGIIHTSWGGTPAEAWTSNASIKGLGDFDELIASLSNPNMEEIKNEWYSRWQSIEIPEKETDWLELNLRDSELTQEDYADNTWEDIELPGILDKRESWRMDGIIWVRKAFMLKEDPKEDFSLSLGAVDDMDFTFINGKQIGSTVGPGKHTLKRTYTVPKTLLKKGINTIAIRVVDTGGGGGINGPITLSTSEYHVDLNGMWKLLATAEIHDAKFYLYDLKEATNLKRPTIIDINSHSPSVLFNAMIAPLIPYAIKGAIWYQGESNVGRAEQYERLFPTMIRDWRNRWQADFPFYFVQIAPFNYGNNLSAALRDAQRKTLSLENTGMAVTLDIGNPVNIHPANKRDVGKRLGGLALKNEYNIELVASGPLYKSHTAKENKLLVSFTEVGSGLKLIETPVTGFEIAGEDKVFKEAKAVIIKEKIELLSPEVERPKYVRYAWKDTSEASLFNQEGLPASSFCSPLD